MSSPRRVVLTGGPGAGKTAVLDLVDRTLCRHVRVLPEAASIVFGGGFPRGSSLAQRRAAQRAIFHVQRELEASIAGQPLCLVLCDRGTIDGLAYWPGPDDMFAELGTTLDAELARYDGVIHLRTPSWADGYNHANPLRIETPGEAAAIDAAIARGWATHPHRHEVAATPDFLAKARHALELIRHEMTVGCAMELADAQPVAVTSG